MTEFTLHSFWQSGNAYKAALMLQLCGADWQPHRVAFFDGETRSQGFREQNVMGEVPVLVHHRDGGDLTLSQSGAILYHLAGRFGRFGPETEAEEHEVLRWILFDNHKFSAYSATARFLRTFRQKPDDDAVVAFFLGRVRDVLRILDTHMKGREWVAADRPTIADLSLCGYQLWPAEIGYDPAEFPEVVAWVERIRALPGWASPQDLMPSGM